MHPTGYRSAEINTNFPAMPRGMRVMSAESCHKAPDSPTSPFRGMNESIHVIVGPDVETSHYLLDQSD